MKAEALHLGDGAYVTRYDDGSYIITANHHDPRQASDKIWIESEGMELLAAFLNGQIRGETVEVVR
jgi:hypothetical protein